MSAEEGFVKVPCFAQMKIAQTLFKNKHFVCSMYGEF